MRKFFLFFVLFPFFFTACHTELASVKPPNYDMDTMFIRDSFLVSSGPASNQERSKNIEYEISFLIDDITVADTIILNNITFRNYYNGDTIRCDSVYYIYVLGEKNKSVIREKILELPTIFETHKLNDMQRPYYLEIIFALPINNKKKHTIMVSYSLLINGEELKTNEMMLKSKRFRMGFRHIEDIFLTPFYLIELLF